jgi:hypothetical protein
LRWTCDPREEEGERGPSPCLFDKIDIEDVRFLSEVVRMAERVWEVAEERIGSVEVGVI